METPTKIQEILEQQRRKEVVSSEVPPEEATESPYYGLWKGAAREMNERYLDLRFRDGQRTCFDYPDRKFVNYNPELPSIDMDFSGNMVTIIGRNIEPLYELFIQRKTQWIKEADQAGDDPEGEGVFIEEILITPAEGFEEPNEEQENEAE